MLNKILIIERSTALTYSLIIEKIKKGVFQEMWKKDEINTKNWP